MKLAENSLEQVENTVGKGEIVRYEQFLLFPVFSKDLYLQTRKNQGLFGKGLILYKTTKLLTCLHCSYHIYCGITKGQHL